MFLEIVTPTSKIFNAEAISVTVPGAKGEFQVLNNHASTVSLLNKGIIKIQVEDSSKLTAKQMNNQLKNDSNNKNLLILTIGSGVVEVKANKVVVLVD